MNKYTNGKQLNEYIDTLFDNLYEKLESMNLDLWFYSKGYIQLVEYFSSYQTKDITWLSIRNSAQISKAYKLHLIFLVQLLENRQLNCEYSNNLYRLLPTLKNLTEYKGYRWDSVFCYEDITELKLEVGKYKKFEAPSLKNKNSSDYVRSLFVSFLDEYTYFSRSNLDIIAILEKSLDDNLNKVNSYTFFNDNTFWSQIKHVKVYYKNNIKLSKESVKYVISFYRYLTKKFIDHNFFKDSLSMSYHLLYSTTLLTLINDGYYITVFNPLYRIYDKDKICFLINGYNKLSTNLKPEDSVRVDLTRINSYKIKCDILDYFYSNPNISKFSRSDKLYIIINIIAVLEELKSGDSYPNPDLNYVNGQEAIFIREYINSKKIEVGTKNNRIYQIKDFLEWEKQMNRMRIDDTALECFERIERPIPKSAKAIPDSDLIELNNIILNKISDNPVFALYHTLFHLLIQTEFRVNQILHLEIDCIRPAIKPNHYIVSSISKTSQGTINEYVITEYTHKILKEIINSTNDLRKNCQTENLNKYIFLYEGEDKVIRLMSLLKFNLFFKKCCKELGWNHYYSASNLRDTHMTKGFENSLRTQKGNLNLSIITGHKRVDTTINHYIDMRLDEMLETTYGIEIGSHNQINLSGKIANSNLDKVNNSNNVVENGCGLCKNSRCINPSLLPCLICEYFITTTEHEIYFKKAIEVIDSQIDCAKTEHDKEDLVTIKKLHVLYLKEIYKFKENELNDRS